MAFHRPLASPPLDGSILLHQIPDFNLIHNPEHVFYTWKDAHTEETHELTHLEFGRAVHRAAAAVKHLDRGQPVGVLALCDTVLYHALFLGLMKAGHVPYLLSPRNSAAATAKLLTDVGCHQVLATPFTLAPVLNEVRELLEQSNYAISFEEIPTTESVFPHLGREIAVDPFVECDTVADDVQLSSVAFYLHSSGSTGLPKTIPQTQQSILHWCTFQCITDLRLHRPGLRIGATILPSFHTLGIYFQLLTPLVALCVINVAPPICPPKTSLPFVASPANALDHARATGCNSIVIIPAILEMWSSNPDSVAFLRTFHVVWFSGGTLSEVVGDALARSGVTVNSVYGATEVGAPVHTVPFARDIADGDWIYLRFDSRVNIQWVPYGDDLFEAVFLPTNKHTPAVFNLPHEQGYATGDLFKRHPSKDLWKVVSRTDDVIVLSSGEKAVPGPAEDIICSSPAVSICMMFGRERHQVGLIVQPSQPLDSSDEAAILAFKQSIHAVIEQANDFNPAFARILPEMVFITQASKPLIRNAKGALHRKVCLAAFEQEISAMYDDTNNPQADENLPSLHAGFTESELSEWLQEQIQALSNKDVRSEGDLFEQGLDSITISSLRHRLVSALTRLEHASVPQITLDWIYQHPSIHVMVASLCSSPTSSSPASIQSVIDKYSKILRPRVPDTDAVPPNSGVIVLTGSTGALGSQILALLVTRADVTAIYCLNRHVAGETLLERQKRAFRKIGLDENQLQSPKVQLLLADLNAPKLGLPADVVTELERSSFGVIHTAWRLDFNLTLPSFESHILATVNLINFASNYPGFRGFYFTSSIGAVQGWASDDPVPEIVMPEADLARGQGYGEGKYVIERLLEIANVNSVSFRIGQISGGPPLGAWPVTEWFPILVKSSIAMKIFPVFDGSTSWVPSDAVAHTILDTVFDVPGGSHSVVNVAHPHPVPWNNIAAWIVEGLGDPQIRQVVAKEWVDALRQEYGVDLRGNKLDDMPALKLLPFFEALTAAQKRTEVGGLPTLAVSNARLLDLPPLNPKDAERWVKYWRASGFL
ncbi:acetyl-CoA synthetase-like protein [Mycena alexandri]|uniref:Acetyl-CoA synthetase-like protein n=1 Tax=Mycena alexandri TaxID=1745969 RepID=A0AAD6T1W5_9AGAR|nr:acetyl-CoA synthetase-like protein [Mycena alexandri]